jgi:3'-phosphoadenosine 5'-phosphosulfate (PAPS) 3'-phosphatase
VSGLPEGNWNWIERAAPIAMEAGALLREFYARGVATEYKTDVDIVTEADRTSEKLLLDRLGEAFPEHGVFGEEGTRERLDAEYRWYIDPLDGTTNFAHGFPVFCVSMGLERRPAGLAEDADGELVAGVIYDPLRDGCMLPKRRAWARRCWRRAFPVARGMPTRMSTFIRSSRCARMVPAGRAQQRSTLPMWPRAAWTATGSFG